MFGANTLRTGLTLTRVLSGISRSLNFANQVIPLYQQAKPMINNARQVISAIKEFSHSNPVPTKQKISPVKGREKNGLKANLNSSNPIFFQ